MAILDNQKVDFLWKKVIYGVTETDIDGKEGPNETIPSPVATYSTDIWAQADRIPVPAAEDAEISELLTLECTADPTVAGGVTWLATSTAGDIDSRLTDFIAPTFDPAYLVGVFDGDPDSGGQPLNTAATNNEWVFDYLAGVLHFPNDSPSPSSIWIRAYRYIGTKGLSGEGIGNPTNKRYADIAERDADAEVLAGQFALVDDAGDGEYAFYVATSNGPAGDWTLLSTEDSSDVDAKTLTGVIDFDTVGGELVLGNASAGKRVVNVTVDVTIPFDGTGPELTVGIDGDEAVLMVADENDLELLGMYEVSSNYTFANPVDTDLKVVISGTGATQGSATVTVSFL